ncbi:kinesin-like protein KIN-14Q isoform X1 [Iris pallida]|uniref:Kinesin-like protein KIN-14Q isoform X1 n=1 Tax=Iris pallida TaxID=29817 RepID=A0AAX6F8I7_IRIPA|nr:kinesin-like protein KIN-14Q isoform X1 [Iris pallida]
MMILVAKSINMDRMPSEDAWQAQEDFICNFTHLQTVQMTSFTGTNAVLKFLEFILANVSLLERMQIQFRKKVGDEEKRSCDSCYSFNGVQ